MKNIASRFVLSWYGSIFALGGSPADVEQIANLLVNNDNSAPSPADAFVASAEFANEPLPERLTTPTFNTSNRRSLSVHKTHQSFAYVVLPQEDIERAFALLLKLQVPRNLGKGVTRRTLRRRLKLVPKLAHSAFLAIPRENFLVGQNLRRQQFAASVQEGAVVATVDGDGDWLDNAVLDGVRRAQSETVVAHR